MPGWVALVGEASKNIAAVLKLCSVRSQPFRHDANRLIVVIHQNEVAVEKRRSFSQRPAPGKEVHQEVAGAWSER